METNENEPDIYAYPKEIADLVWNNTTEELVKKGYKIRAVNYEKVCINIWIL